MKLLTLLMAVLFCTSIHAAADTYFYVDKEVKAKPGEIVTFALAMKNVKNILGFQLWLTLPNGITVNQRLNEDEELEFDTDLTARKKAKHVLDLDVTYTGALQMIGEPTDGRSYFKGNDGDILTVNLKVDPNIQPGQYNINISNIAFTPEDMQEIEQEAFDVPITIYQDYTITATPLDEAMGNVTGSGTYQSGTNVTLTATPNEGYHFTNWSNGVKENPYTFIAEKDFTLTAAFDANEYNLIYMVDGVEYKKYAVKYGSQITPEALPTKVGHTFSGWSEIPTTMPAEDFTVTGTFVVNKYTFTFDTDGGSEVTEITQDYKSEVTAPANPTKTGYTFVSWDKEIPETMPAESMTFKAIWKINQYTLTFDVDGGTEVASITQDYNTAVTAPANPTKVGYTFAGWDKEIPETMPAENMTFKATWKTNQYTFTFDTDGGSEVAEITQDYKSEVTAPANPTKSGYTFVRWDKEIPETMPAESMTFKAIWKINQYTLTFDVDGGTEVASITQDYNTAVTAPANPTKVGYTFAGWDKEIPETMPAENMTFKATWKTNQYTFTFDTDGGSEVAEITQDYKSEVTAPANPTKTGYTFVRWDKEIPETMPAESMTFKAIWKINQYTLTFDVDGGTEVASITQDYNTAVTAPANPTKVGYTFAGWDKEIPKTMPAEDMLITALWNVNSYKLIYMVDGEIYKEKLVDYGTELIAEESPTKDGYAFTGWSEIPATMPDHDVVINGSFTPATGIAAILANKKVVDVYNLNGNLVKRQVDVKQLNKELSKGIYIICGMKLVIK